MDHHVSPNVVQVGSPVVQISTIKQTDRFKASEAVTTRNTAAESEVGRDIKEAIQGIPDSLGESEISWPEDMSGLESMIERHLGVPGEANYNSRPAAPNMMQRQFHSPHTAPFQAGLPIQQPYHKVQQGNIVSHNGQPTVGRAEQQAQTRLPPQLYQGSQSVPVPNMDPSVAASPCYQPQQPVPQTHLRPNEYPYAQNHSTAGMPQQFPATYGQHFRQASQVYPGVQSIQTPYILQQPQFHGQTPQNHQFQQDRGLGLGNPSQHNGGFQQNGGYGQSNAFQQGNGFQQSSNF